MLRVMGLIPDGWRPRAATLVFVERGADVLLIRKKRGHGAGKVNAPGGRLEPSETPAACARRELWEEVGVRSGALHPSAVLRFHDRTDGHDVLGFVFRSMEFDGQPVETPEAVPFWCPWDAVPYEEMWAADRYWIPSVRDGRPVRGDFVFEGERLACSCVSRVEATGVDRFLAEFDVRAEELAA